jgi:hypothetical protein
MTNMSKNLKRHRLLKILAEKYIKASQGHEQGLGVSWEDLMSKLRWDMDELLDVSSTLFSEEEVAKHDAYGIEGIYAKTKGVSAYSSKKYKREHERIIFDRIKNWVQTVIPIVSLVITFTVILLSEFRLKNKNKQIDELTKRINKIEYELMKSNELRIDTIKAE